MSLKDIANVPLLDPAQAEVFPKQGLANPVPLLPGLHQFTSQAEEHAEDFEAQAAGEEFMGFGFAEFFFDSGEFCGVGDVEFVC